MHDVQVAPQPANSYVDLGVVSKEYSSETDFKEPGETKRKPITSTYQFGNNKGVHLYQTW